MRALPHASSTGEEAATRGKMEATEGLEPVWEPVLEFVIELALCER